MLGRVRAASSTPYDLELERMPSKLIKDDSLSIYEATLVKLKLGARRDLGPPPEVSIEIETDCDSAIGANSCSDTLSACLAESGCNSHSVFKGFQRVTSHEDVMMTDSEFSSVCISPSSSDCQSIARLQQHPSKNLSVLYLFSKYRSSGQAISSSQDEAKMTDNYGSSVSNSPHSSDCQSLKSSKEQLEQDCVSSVRQILGEQQEVMMLRLWEIGLQRLKLSLLFLIAVIEIWFLGISIHNQ